MRVLQINSVCGIRSTGRIVVDIADKLRLEGHECKIAYGRECAPDEYKKDSYKIGNKLNVYINVIKARILGNEGFNAKKETIKFLEWADKYNPDLLWIHNLHGYYLNIELLFNWIKSRPQMEVYWTLHDCWSFTGHCTYFSFVNCEKWKVKCQKCYQKKVYPTSLFIDSSEKNYIKKERAFTHVSKMNLITPSNWLAELVKQSFLKEYPINVVYNQIDLSVFKPIKSNFKKSYNLEDKIIILGVASVWDKRKGLEDFIELSKLLDDSYQIVLVGISKKQRKSLPSDILCIQRTDCVEKLVEIYSAADVYVNTSKEETFGLTTIEALACGTPAIVYKNTACEEIVNLYGGIAVEQSAACIYKAILDIIEKK